MVLFKKGTALLCALTMLSSVAAPILPLATNSLTVMAAGVANEDEIVVKDYKTGEIISSQRYIETYNAPAGDELDAYEEELTSHIQATDTKGRVTKEDISYYRVEHYVTSGAIVVGLSDAKYKNWIAKKYDADADETHLYIIRDLRVQKLKYKYSGDSTEPSETSESWSIKKAPVGLFQVTVTREDGETYRNYTFNMKQPTSSLTVEYNNVGYKEKTRLEKGGGAIIVSNHPIQITAKQSSSVADGLVYTLVSSKKTDKPSKIAKISDDGILTPTGNGTVYLKVSSTANKDYYVMSLDKDTGKPIYELVLPQYFTFTIVKENPATEVKFVKKYSTLNVGDTRQLKLKVTPSYNTDEYPTSATDIFSWSTSNKKVVTVDANGALKAVGPGEATVTVTAENKNVKDSFVVKVLVPVTTLEIDKGVQLYEDDTQEISVKLRPNYSNEKITWTSSDSSIVTVTSGKTVFADGAYSYTAKLNGVKAGTAKITASTASGISASMTVTVKKKLVVDSIRLLYNNKVITANTCNIFVGQTINYQMLGVQGEEIVSSDKIKVSMTKSASKYAEVAIDDNGEVTCKGIARGSFSLKFTSSITPSVSRVLQVNIKRPADSITSTVDGKEQHAMSLSVGATAKAEVELYTNSVDGIHDDKISTYKSSNTAVATVDKNGNIKVVGEGTAKITVRTASAKEFDIVTITGVKVARIAIKGVVNGKIEKDTPFGKSLDLEVTAYDSKNKKYVLPVKWEVDKTGILSINEDNQLIVNKLGTVQVACTVGELTVQFKVILWHQMKSCKVKQTAAAEIADKVKPSLKITDGTKTLVLGTDYTIDVLVSPKLGSNKTIVRGKGNYKGTLTVNFEVVAHDISKAQVSGLTAKVYTGEVQQVKPVVKYNSVKLIEGTDYTLSYKNNKTAGIASIIITGKGNYKNKYTATYKITPANMSKTVITVEDAKYSAGKAVIPKYKITFNGKTVSSSDYTVRCINNTKLGIGTIYFTGQNNFTGTVSKTFRVVTDTPLKITPSSTSEVMAVGNVRTIRVTIADAAYVLNKKLTYKSSNNGVATVDQNGKVTAVKKGTSIITITAGKAKATVSITVK